MKPPPPIFPAAGHVTAKANAVATAASTALPPPCSTSSPTSLAGADTDTTLPWVTSVRPSDDAASLPFSGAAATGTPTEMLPNGIVWPPLSLHHRSATT